MQGLIAQGCRALVAATMAALVLAGSAQAEPWRPVPQSCVSASGSGGACAVGRSASGLWKVVVAPGGAHAYGIAWNVAALLIFDRNPATGQLVQRGAGGCVSDSGSGCAPARGLANVSDIAISPDGAQIYTDGGQGLAVFDRNPTTGDVTQKPGASACVTADGSYTYAGTNTPGVCTPARGGAGGSTLLISPDGRFLYAGAGPVTVLRRDPTTGVLSQAAGAAGCVTADGSQGCAVGRGLSYTRQMAMSPDGHSLYVPSYAGNSLLVFDRDPASGALQQKNGAAGCFGAAAGCTPDPRITQTQAATVSPDGANVYLSVGTGLLTYVRAGDGSLTPQSCITDSGGNGCSAGRNLVGMSYSAMSPDGQTLVANLENNPGFDIFTRDGAGNLSQPAGGDGCVTQSGAAVIHGSAVAGQCFAHPAAGANGQITFTGDAQFMAGSYALDAMLVLKRDFFPVCQDGAFTVTQNTAAPLPLTCSDRNGDPLAYQVAVDPLAGALGAVDNAAARVFYNPFANFLGEDAFTYRAVSTGLPSNTAKVSLKVAPPVTPPAPPVKPRTVTSPVTYNWYLKSRRSRIMRIQSLVVRSLPMGATVTLRCSGKKCPFTKRTIKRSRKSTMNVLKAKTLRHKVTFRAGQTVDVRIAAPGMNTKVLRFKLRKGKVPKHQSYCIALGKTKLQRSC